MHGTEEQKERYLPPMLRGEEMWCQLFSEPEAGSDLANLSTRAVRDGDVFVVNGQKIWTSLAQVAKFGILIARTDTDTSKYTGISYFIIPMDLPGIEIRPLRNMVGGYGDAGFCEVFFTDVAVPAENLIGSLNGGWAMAKETLANERVSLSEGGPPVGARADREGPGRPRPAVVAASRDGPPAPALAAAYIDGEILRYHQLRQISAKVNKKPGPDASLRKALKDPHGKVVFGLAKDLMGAGACSTWRRRPQWAPGRAASCSARAHRRRRDVRGAAQHHRRADPQTAPCRRAGGGGRARLLEAGRAERWTTTLRRGSGTAPTCGRSPIACSARAARPIGSGSWDRLSPGAEGVREPRWWLTTVVVVPRHAAAGRRAARIRSAPRIARART